MPRTNTPKNVRFARTLDSLFDTPGQTRSDLNLLPVYAAELVAENLIKTGDDVKTGQRGRPAHTYKLTDKARKRVKRQRLQDAWTVTA